MATRPTMITCLLAVFGVIAAIMVARSEGGPTTGADAGPLLAPDEMPIDQVSGIRLDRRGKPTLVFERRDGIWRQREPIEHPLDGYAIRQLAAEAAAIVPVRRIGLSRHVRPHRRDGRRQHGRLRGRPVAASGDDPHRGTLPCFLDGSDSLLF